MIEIIVGIFILLIFSSEDEKEKIEPEEYYPFMYDHFTDDGESE